MAKLSSSRFQPPDRHALAGSPIIGGDFPIPTVHHTRREPTNPTTDHDKAQASFGMAHERVREVAEGRAEPFEPIQVSDRQRKALESALGDASAASYPKGV